MNLKQLPQFGTMPDGQPVDHYRLENGAFAVEVLSLGGVIYRLEVPDRNNRAGNVVLNVPTVEAMLSPKSSYLGALIGRFANRIGFGRFALEGETYELAINDPPHCLHGGKVGYDKRIWTIKPHASPDGPALELSLVDEGGTENFPGTVKVTVIYTLLIDGLRISYRATSDQPTPINLTNHSYFNLKDAGRSSVLDHVVQLQADYYTPSDATLVPTGEILPVEKTSFDFREGKPIGRDLAKLGNEPRGYDHNFVVSGSAGALRQFAKVQEPTTGRVMIGYTTELGVQLYSGNFLNGTTVGAAGFAYQQHSGLCLETQHYPDSPNVPQFPNTILRPGETFETVTKYRFAVVS